MMVRKDVTFVAKRGRRHLGCCRKRSHFSPLRSRPRLRREAVKMMTMMMMIIIIILSDANSRTKVSISAGVTK